MPATAYFSSAASLVLALVLAPACTFYTCPSEHCGASGSPAAQGGSSGSGQGDAGNSEQGGNGTGGNGTGGMAPEPTGEWVSVTGKLTTLVSECGNMSYVSSKPDEDLLIAGIAQQGLWGSRDGGQSWSQLGTGKGSAVIVNRTTSITYDPVAPNTFWESGIYNDAGAYVTVDNGKTFQSYDIQRNDYVSIDFGDPKRQTLLASGHEADHLLYRSSDGGKTWLQIGDKEPKGVGACSYPIVLDAHTFLLGCRSYAGSSGIFRSTDAGETWTPVSKNGGAAAPLLAQDGSIYFTSDVNTGLTRSTDQGESWSDLGPVNVVDWGVAPLELPDGRLASVGNRRVVVSADKGKTWQTVSSKLPFEKTVSGVVYSKWQKAFFVWYLTCDETSARIPDDAIVRYDWDFEQP